jgi:hypothetical protein
MYLKILSPKIKFFSSARYEHSNIGLRKTFGNMGGDHILMSVACINDENRNFTGQVQQIILLQQE